MNMETKVRQFACLPLSVYVNIIFVTIVFLKNVQEYQLCFIILGATSQSGVWCVYVAAGSG